MKLKTDDAGHVVVQDGKPVYVADDGKEVAFDYTATLGTISRLNGEAKGHRERAEAAEAKLKAFDGLDDPDAARKALATVRNLDDKQLIAAGEVDRIKAEAIKAVEQKFEPVVKERDKLSAQLREAVLGHAFAGSKFIADRLVIPADITRAAFGNSFKVDGGRVVPMHPNGDPIYSRAKPGEIADFDEALEILVSAYPNRDSILKGSGASGSGAGPTKPGPNGKPTMTRAQFDALDPMAQRVAAKEATITD